MLRAMHDGNVGAEEIHACSPALEVRSLDANEVVAFSDLLAAKRCGHREAHCRNGHGDKALREVHRAILVENFCFDTCPR